VRILQVRRATEDDIDAIQRIGQETWPPTYAAFGPDYVADGLRKRWSREATLNTLRNTTVVVAQGPDGQLVGMGNVDLRPDVPVIWKLYVLPDAHGTGVGAALLHSLIDALPAGTAAVRLEYVDGNVRAERFYRKQGFVEFRRDPGEQSGWPQIVWMEKLLSASAPTRPPRRGRTG
jgi:ribosomal protein S18 acetylase RimI-like enzyme